MLCCCCFGTGTAIACLLGHTHTENLGSFGLGGHILVAVPQPHNVIAERQVSQGGWHHL